MDFELFFSAIVRAFKLAFQVVIEQFLDLDGIISAFGSLGSLIGEEETDAPA